MYQHMESIKTSLHSPITEVTMEPYRQSPGRTRDPLVSRSLILTRPTIKGREANVKDESSRLFRCLVYPLQCSTSTSIPRAVQMFSFYLSTNNLEKDDYVPDAHGSNEDPRRKEESRWVTLYHHLLADGIRSHSVHVYALLFCLLQIFIRK